MKLEEFEINVYSCDGSISGSGYSNDNKGMVYFDYGNVGCAIRGESKLLAKSVTSTIANELRKNSGIKLIKFIFPKNKKSVSHYLDGFFGRPAVCAGATLLKSLSQRRREAFIREINKISEIEDRWGNRIKLII